MQEERVSKEKGSSFEEIRASGKCTVPLYFAFSLMLVFACALLALTNLDLNAPVLEPVTFDDRVEASSSTPADAKMTEEEDASEPEESSGEHDDRDEDSDADYDEED